MKVIPNVYEAAWAKSYSNNVKSKVLGKTIEEFRIKQKTAFNLGMASARPYTIETQIGGDEFKGHIVAVNSQTEVAKVLNKYKLDYFPEKTVFQTVKGKSKLNPNKVPITQQSVSGFLRYANSGSFKTEKGNTVIISYRSPNDRIAKINKKDLFDF